MSVITVSRQIGSAVGPILKKLSDHLGYDIIDKQIIFDIAREAGVREYRVERYDEAGKSPIARFIRKVIQSESLKLPDSFSGRSLSKSKPDTKEFNESKYLQLLRTVIENAASRGNCIIVGRGSQMILGNHPGTLHIRIICNREKRIEEITRERKVNSKQAESLLNNSDKTRKNYLLTHFKADIEDPDLYDLVINTSRIDGDTAVKIIEDAVHTF